MSTMLQDRPHRQSLLFCSGPLLMMKGIKCENDGCELACLPRRAKLTSRRRPPPRILYERPETPQDQQLPKMQTIIRPN
jgi:hypothetical protein